MTKLRDYLRFRQENQQVISNCLKGNLFSLPFARYRRNGCGGVVVVRLKCAVQHCPFTKNHPQMKRMSYVTEIFQRNFSDIAPRPQDFGALTTFVQGMFQFLRVKSVSGYHKILFSGSFVENGSLGTSTKPHQFLASSGSLDILDTANTKFWVWLLFNFCMFADSPHPCRKATNLDVKDNFFDFFLIFRHTSEISVLVLVCFVFQLWFYHFFGRINLQKKYQRFVCRKRVLQGFLNYTRENLQKSGA